MLEIIALVFLTRALSREARLRGRAASWAALGPLLWIVAEVAAAVFATSFGFGAPEIVIIGLAAGAVGGGVSYVVVTSLAASPWAEVEV